MWHRLVGGIGLAYALAMLLLRHGGDFIEQRIEQHRWSVFRYIAVGMIVFAVVSLTVSPILGLMAGVVVAVGAKANFKQWGNWSAGKEGEVAVTEALRFLPNEYVLLNDLMLPNGRGNVDHLVIGPNGIFVIETKNYSGYVKCWGDQWYVNRREIGSLSKQAKRNAMAIRNTLDMVFKDHSTRIPFVNALLVFTNRNGRLNLKRPTIPVLRSSDLVRFIAGYNATKANSFASSELTRAIVHRLHLLQQKPDKLVANS